MNMNIQQYGDKLMKTMFLVEEKEIDANLSCTSEG